MRPILFRWWPAAAVLAALASTGGAGGTCFGGGGEDPTAGDCLDAADCEGLPHVACLGQWACEAGACQWHCDLPPATNCRTAADCGGGAHDACDGAWTCRDDGTCAWACDTPPPAECLIPEDCDAIDALVACDGRWTCVDGKCLWECVGPPFECSADEQCGEGLACVNGTCQAVAPDCVVSGCSGEICAAEPMASDCLWLEWYGCLPLTTCGLLADGQCGWDPTPAFVACRDGGTACASDEDCRKDPDACPDPEACDLRCIDGLCAEPQCTPVPETCNGVDDDCNGIVDDGCPVQKECYRDADCALGQFCDHEGFADAPGCCVPLPDGSGCPDGYPLCPGVCRGLPVPCASDDECGAGQACVAGTCVTAGPSCRTVKPGSHGACKMLVGWIWDGKQCVAEGGCGCEPDCDAFFPDRKSCEAACGAGRACSRDADCGPAEACVDGLCTVRACRALEPGSHGFCEMVVGVLFDGKQCVTESGCGCEPDCAWIFPDLVSCWKACNAWPPD